MSDIINTNLSCKLRTGLSLWRNNAWIWTSNERHTLRPQSARRLSDWCYIHNNFEKMSATLRVIQIINKSRKTTSGEYLNCSCYRYYFVAGRQSMWNRKQACSMGIYEIKISRRDAKIKGDVRAVSSALWCFELANFIHGFNCCLSTCIS